MLGHLFCEKVAQCLHKTLDGYDQIRQRPVIDPKKLAQNFPGSQAMCAGRREDMKSTARTSNTKAKTKKPCEGHQYPDICGNLRKKRW